MKSGIDYFLDEKVQGSATNLILFILVIFIAFILGFNFIFGFQSVTENYFIFLLLIGIMILILIWVAIFYEPDKHMHTDRHPFNMETLKSSRIKHNFINIAKEYRTDFDRLLKGM